MSKYGLKFERKEEACVEQLKTHHVFLTEDTTRSFVRNEKRHHNILIEGENYQALRVLSYTHAGKVDVIYLDPPYNTGNKDFVYNDTFVDDEDTFRHSKWLSFMESRLKLARPLMNERGIIFISIDDNEFAQLKLLCDEVFGEQNFIANMIWKKKHSGAHDSRFVDSTHEYVLVYAKNKEYWKSNDFAFNKISANVGEDDSYSLSDQYEAVRGKYKVQPLAAAKGYVKSLYYAITCPDGSVLYPDSNARGNKGDYQWVWNEERTQNAAKNAFLAFKQKGDGSWTVGYKQYQLVDKDGNSIERGNPIQSILNNDTFNPTNVSSSSEIRKIFDGESVFDYAKPTELIKRLLFVASQKDSIILDFFAGSGTTGQAVAELNKEDGGTRQFILVTNNDKSDKLLQGICHQVTYPRLDKTIGNENLKYFRVETLRKANNKVAAIGQLELHSRLVPTLCLMNNTFHPVERGSNSQLFTNHTNDVHLAVWSNTNGKQRPINQSALNAFQKKLVGRPNLQLEINRPRRGYACKYVEFMSQ